MNTEECGRMQPMNNYPLLNDSRCLSGGSADACFGLSSGAGLSCGGEALPISSAHTMRLLERMMSHGGVLLGGGKRFAAAAAIAACIGLTVTPDAYGGDITVSAGETSSGYSLGAGLTYSRMDISSGGTANDTHISSGGWQTVDSGGTANSTYIGSGGQQNVYSGGTANVTHISSGGWHNVYSGGTANDTHIGSGGWQHVSSGATVSGIVQEHGGNINAFVFGGDSTTRITGSNASGSFSLENGVASNFILYGDGTLFVFSGGTANDTHISSGGRQDVDSGATANRTHIGSGGLQSVNPGATANSTHIGDGGGQNVFSGATANNTHISSGGQQNVHSGATANNTHISSGGQQYVNSGATANSTHISNGGWQTVQSGATANSTHIGSDGWQVVFSGGTASDTHINSGGKHNVQSGATANSTYISSGGEQFVRSGGTASGIIQEAGGNVNATVIGGDSTTRISGSNASGSFSLENGVASNFIIYSGGVQNVSSGGTANDTHINSGGVQEVSSGATANDTHINSGGVQEVSSGATANDTHISSGGVQEVSSGATANDTHISSGGQQYVSSGATASGIVQEAGGNVNVTVNGHDSTTRITGSNASGSFSLVNGVASNFIIYSGGGQNVYGGATANSTHISSGGSQNVYGNGVASVTNISSGGSQYVFNNGVANGTNISSGGSQDVYFNGVASDTNISSGGRQNVYSNGVANDTNISSGGSQNVYFNGVASDTNISNGGVQNVYSNGVASDTNISSGGVQNVLDNGVTSDTNISGGTQTVSNGTAIGTTVDSGGSQIVYAGGIASNATITDGFLFASGANVLSGTFSLGANGVIDILSTFQTITELTGTGKTSIGAGGQLTLNQTATTIYDGTLDGAGGAFVKDGSGILTLTHSANTVGNLMVSGGGVALGQNGGTAALTGNAAIFNGGWLGGYGTLTGDITVHAGGTLAAGSAYDSTATAEYGGMTVSGNVNIASGGIYQVRADHLGTDTDAITVTGSASLASGAMVKHVAGGNLDTSVADPTKKWTILTASNIVGNVDSIATSSNLLFLAPVLEINGSDLLMSFERRFTFTDFGDTPNQIAVASGLASLDQTGPLASTILAGITDESDVNALYNQLSGEMHASLTGGLMLLDRDFSRWLLDRSGRNSLARTILSASAPAFQSAQGYASIHPRALECRYANNFWADVGYARQRVDGDGNAGRYTLKGPEVSLGYDHIAPSGWLGGVALRYGNRDMKVNSRLSEADIDSYSVAAYGGFQTTFGPGAARLVLGGAFTRHEIEGKRHVAALGQRLESDYHANSYQLFMEGAYAIPLGRVWLEPFVDLAWTAMRVPGFNESGGNAALRADSQSQNNLSQLLGLRLVLPTFCRVNLEAQAGWRHTYGTLDNAAAYTFAEGGNRFGIKGGKLSRDEAVFDFRGEYRVRDNLRLGLEANAAVGERGTALRGGAFIALEW